MKFEVEEHNRYSSSDTGSKEELVAADTVVVTPATQPEPATRPEY